MEAVLKGDAIAVKNASAAAGAKHTWLYVLLYLLVNLLCCLQHFAAGRAALAVTALILGIGMMVPYEEMGVYLFACLPFYNVMNGQMGSTSLYYLLMGLAVARLLVGGLGKNAVIKVSLFCLIGLLTVFNFSGAQKAYIQWIMRLTPLIAFAGESAIYERLEQIIEKYAVSMLFASAWGWFMLRMGTSIYTGGYVSQGGVGTIRFAGLTGDAVYYSIQLTVVIACLLTMILKKQHSRKMRMALVLLLFVFGLLTYSKTFMVCAAVQWIFAVIYWSYLKGKTQKQLIFRLLGAALMIAAVGAFAYGYVAFSPDRWANNIRARLTVADLSTGRFTVWKYYLDLCASDWRYLLRGVGFDRYSQIVTLRSEATGMYFSVRCAHNLYLEAIVVFGVLEALLLFVLTGRWAARTYKRNRDMLSFLPFISLLLTGVTTHGFFEYSFYLDLLLVVTVAQYGYTLNGDKCGTNTPQKSAAGVIGKGVLDE